MQLVLDIDLDFFLDRIFHCADEPPGRLSPREFRVEPEADALGYLRERCLVTEAEPTPGRACRHHREVFDHWERMIRSGELTVPFEVVHVDAHADMGLGNLSALFIAEELLARPPQRRRAPRGREPWALNNCNFLAYALALRWIGRLTYVTHPRCRDDVQWLHMKDCSSGSGFVQMKQLEPGAAARLKDFNEVRQLPFRAEPEIPMRLVPRGEFHCARRPDFLFVTQSPTYTPPTIDALFKATKAFIGASSGWRGGG